MDLTALTRRLCAHVTDKLTEPPYVFGVSGGQGAGKSTLCAALAERLAVDGLRCLVVGLDDYYLPRAARHHLAKTVHPLCLTRGVPGTHAIADLAETMAQLSTAGPETVTTLAAFSKSHDEQIPPADWRQYRGRPDIILLEGWCVGAQPDFVSAQPQTAWEHAHDPDGIWKQWTIAQAAAYQPVWERCAELMLLRHHSFQHVIDSRWQQEQGNAAASGVWQFKSRDEVAAFCAHYESWTLGLWENLPKRAAFTAARDDTFSYQWLNAD